MIGHKFNLYQKCKSEGLLLTTSLICIQKEIKMDENEASYWFSGGVLEELDAIIESCEKTIERLSNENDISERDLRGCL